MAFGPILFLVSKRIRERRKQRGPGGRAARLSLCVSVLGVVLVLVYVVSRVLTDRFGWSQWLWWAPAGWWVIGVWIGLAVSGVLGVIGWLRGARKTAGGDLFWVYLLVCVGMVVHLVVWVVRVPNSIGGYGIHWTHTHERVRVMHWNIAAGSFDEEQAMEWMVSGNIDLMLLANTRFDGQRRALMEGLKERLGEGFAVRGLSRALVASRYEILSTQVVYVSASGKEGPSEEAVRATGDFGWVVMLTLDGGEMYGVFDVWLVDLPSEPTVHRMESMSRVVEAVRGRLGDEVVDDAVGPAMVIGDFNTVRGSASLGVFDVFSDGGFDDAFAARGSGAGTWRPMGLRGFKGWIAERSSWGIDLSLVGNGWESHGYQLVLPDGADWGDGGVSHVAQVVDIERVD
jgi:Endonuclease/Exonuclease/phosphatase family